MATDPATPSLLSRFEQPLTAFIAGASRGIGLAFVRQLAMNGQACRIWAGCRAPASASALAALAEEFDSIRVLPLDVTDEASLADASAAVAGEAPLQLVVNCAGFLHRPDGPQPERRLSDVRAEWLMESFAVNAIGPLLL
ncbi:SDR family NAD(P)-dependent oxidoreductase, partial [Arthrospira platensis SPKY2]